jgi:hypothetical protein
MHGITMIFLYASPVLSGFSNYLFPLVLGARDMAFPRLNAFSYWVYLAAGLFIYASLLVAAAPNDGWFNYVAYALREYNPGPNLDFYALGMIFLGVSTTVGAANFVVTFLRMRAPGMSLNRVPVLSWGTVTVSLSATFSRSRRSASRSFSCGRTGSSERTSFVQTAGGIRYSGSISSGCSPTLGFTSSYCPRWGSFPTPCPFSAAGRSLVTPRWWSERL